MYCEASNASKWCLCCCVLLLFTVWREVSQMAMYLSTFPGISG